MMITAALPQVSNVTLIANLAFIKVGLITNDTLGIVTMFKLAIISVNYPHACFISKRSRCHVNPLLNLSILVHIDCLIEWPMFNTTLR